MFDQEGTTLLKYQGGPFNGAEYYTPDEDDIRALPIDRDGRGAKWYPYVRSFMFDPETATIQELMVWDGRELTIEELVEANV